MTITIISIAIIAIAFFYCCYRIKKAVKNNTFRQEKNIIEYMPSVLTTLGVLGTFIGITYGLSDFNTTKLLQKSEMRKDIVIELSYRGFSCTSDYS